MPALIHRGEDKDGVACITDICHPWFRDCHIFGVWGLSLKLNYTLLDASFSAFYCCVVYATWPWANHPEHRAASCSFWVIRTSTGMPGDGSGHKCCYLNQMRLFKYWKNISSHVCYWSQFNNYRHDALSNCICFINPFLITFSHLGNQWTNKSGLDLQGLSIFVVKILSPCLIATEYRVGKRCVVTQHRLAFPLSKCNKQIT